MSNQIQISVTNLGRVALPGFCPRCFWVRLRMEHRLPFASFPGIFSTIDSYTKRVVHGWFDEHGDPPPWLTNLGDIEGYEQPPHYTKFAIIDDEHDIRFRGEADGILKRTDGSHVIVDYKTAKHSGNQDALYPQYEAQLNAYARIGDERGFDPVSDLALIYFEPLTDDAAAVHARRRRDDGFAMSFIVDIVPVSVDPDVLRPLLAATREIYELALPPDGRANCKDCALTEQLTALL